MPDLQFLWGPVCWLVDPPDAEILEYLCAQRAYDLGFAGVEEMYEAEHVANRAADPAASLYAEVTGDYGSPDPEAELSALALRYIERHRARVFQSRGAATKPRRSKWYHVHKEALTIVATIRAKRADLSVSSLAELVLEKLHNNHTEVPSRSAVMDWIKDSDG